MKIFKVIFMSVLFACSANAQIFDTTQVHSANCYCEQWAKASYSRIVIEYDSAGTAFNNGGFETDIDGNGQHYPWGMMSYLHGNSSIIDTMWDGSHAARCYKGIPNPGVDSAYMMYGNAGTWVNPPGLNRHYGLRAWKYYLISFDAKKVMTDGKVIDTIIVDPGDWEGYSPWTWYYGGTKGEIRIAVDTVRRHYEIPPHQSSNQGMYRGYTGDDSVGIATFQFIMRSRHGTNRAMLFDNVRVIEIPDPDTFYVSQSGSDLNSGHTPAAPWKSLNNICDSTFTAGDKILFNRGETFYGEISKSGLGFRGLPQAPITFGTYGTGAKPIIMGDCSEGTWTQDTRRDSLWKKFVGYTASVNGWEKINGTWTVITNNNANTKWTLSNTDSLTKFLNTFNQSSYDATTYTGWDTIYVQTHDGLSPQDSTIFFRNSIWSGDWLVIKDLEFRNYSTAINPYPMNHSIIRNCEFRNNRYISIFLAGGSDHNLVDSCTVHNGGYTGMYSWYSHGNVFRHDTVRNIGETVLGTVGGSEHAGMGFERDTATVVEYCVIENCISGGFDSFYNMQDTIRYCTVNNTGYGGIYLSGDSWVCYNNTITATIGVNVNIGRYHTIAEVSTLGLTHVYNNTINCSARGLNFAGNFIEGSFGNGSGGTLQFDNNTVTGTTSGTNLDINNDFFTGRFTTGVFPDYVFYTSLTDFHTATGYEEGSTFNETPVPPDPPAPVKTRRFSMFRKP
jgi:hypothetical protein